MIIKNVVFTGGPCSGKTKTIEFLRNYYEKLGYKVFVVKETSTEIIESGFNWKDNPVSKFNLQSAIFDLQLKKENIIKNLAKNSKYEKILIFYDRGLLDGKGYIAENEFLKICSSNNLSEQDIIDRYDYVIHLQTVSRLNSKYYGFNNKYRKSAIEESIDFDNLVYEAWKNHPNLISVDSTKLYENKLINVKSYLDNLLQQKNIITISGNLGSGKSTVAIDLGKELNLDIYSSGDIMRDIASKHGMDINQFNDYLSKHEELDSIMDDEIIKISNEKNNLIFVSRLAWYLIPQSFKVYMYVDDDIGAKRILNDKKRNSEQYLDYDEALKSTRERFQKSRNRFIKKYGVDICDKANYDLFIDTTYMSIDEVKKQIMSEYKKYISKKEGVKEYVKSINNY